MLENEALLFSAKLNSQICTIDLHGIKSIFDALDKMEKELFLAVKNNQPYCKIIFGIGTGILKNNVEEALKKNPIIKFWEVSDDGGSCIVFFS